MNISLRSIRCKTFSSKGIQRLFLAVAIALCMVLIGTKAGLTTFSPTSTIKIYDHPLGTSTRYIGACEGNVNFEAKDLQDLGINTYRIYGGMSRWEPQDDDGQYGFPMIAQIKNNPDLIPWQYWDEVMSNPKTGTDYAFSGQPEGLWQGSAQTIFETLKQKNIRPVLTIRNTDPGWNPDWALQLNPPRTDQDWHEWWEHVFATVYWLNVRNNYQVDDFEIHNEPDNRQQGWGGTQEDYFRLVQIAKDAIAHVYNTYLPDRSYHIHAPKTMGGSFWPRETLKTIPANFDIVNIHNYDSDISTYIQQVQNWMQETIHARSPIWVGEWGTYKGGYNDLSFSLNLIKNLIKMSQPGDTYIEGSHLFSLYDWGEEKSFEGLIDSDGNRRLSYYALRMGIRALQGGRQVLLTKSSNPDLMTIATQDDSARIFLLIVNSDSEVRTVQTILPAFKTQKKLIVWEFSQTRLDVAIQEKSVEGGSISFSVPSYSSRLIQIQNLEPD